MANTKQLDLARWATQEAIKAGADEARVSVQRQRYISISYRERQIEKLEEATTNGLNVSFYINGKYSSHRTSDLRRDALSRFIAESVAMTGFLTEDPHRRLPEPRFYQGRKNLDLELLDGGYQSVEADKRHQVAKTVEAAALDAGGDRILSVTAGYFDSHANTATVASNGFEGTTEETAFWAGADVTARDEGDKRPAESWWQGGPQRDFLTDPAEIGRKATARALGRVGSGKIKSESLPVIVENQATGRLFGWLGQAFSGRNLQQKQSFLEGKQIASSILTLTDDPFVKRGQNSRLFDNEGIAARRMPMIENGMLMNYYIDSYYARKLGVEPTTGGRSNVVFALGDKSQDGWIKELGRGILVTSFMGGNSNSSTGDFSAGIQGFYFENGSIVKPVSELNIAGNHLEFWKQLVGLGNDPNPYSSLRAPCVIFDGVSVAGA
jgi:PmbA protein